MLTFSILTFNVWESAVFAPTCKLISFPDIFSVVAALVAIFNPFAVAFCSISAETVNFILFPLESDIVITESFAILPVSSNPFAAIPYPVIPSNSIFAGVPPFLAVVFIFISLTVKSSKSNPSWISTLDILPFSPVTSNPFSTLTVFVPFNKSFH